MNKVLKETPIAISKERLLYELASFDLPNAIPFNIWLKIKETIEYYEKEKAD